MIRKVKILIAFFIALTVTYYLYINARVYHKYEYVEYLVDIGDYSLDVSLDANYSESYEKNSRIYTDTSTNYDFYVTFQNSENSEVELVFNNVSIKSEGVTIINLVVPNGIYENKVTQRVYFNFGEVVIPKDDYNDLDILLNIDINNKNGTTENFIIKGKLKTNFQWSFSWDTFDMIMSV